MYKKYLPIPPRDQWENNYGYCGEVAMISAGLYYGQYVSQYDARAIASNDENQSKDSSQLLVGAGNNDRHAAKGMHLTFSEWNSDEETSTKEFLAWIKMQIINNCPVAIGVYMNKFIFGGDDMEYDDYYDHIVPVFGIESIYPLSDTSYYDDDIIVFSDNGLYTPDNEPVPYEFKCRFDSFKKNRADANLPSTSVYSLAVVTKNVKNCGIALTGIANDGSTLPIRVTTNVNYEIPEIEEGSGTRPSPMPIELTVTVSGLQPNVRYNLYRYDSMGKVPKGEFNKYASNSDQAWHFVSNSPNYSHIDRIVSSNVAVYRAVEASAP